jgi:cytochrome c-type biogenesis protein CcmF
VAASSLGVVRSDERWRRTGRWLLAAAVGAGLVAVGALGSALLRSDFTLAYVVEQSRSRGSAWYRLAGLWGGMAGSLLVWTALLAGVGLVAAWRLARTPIRLGAAAQAVAAAVVTGFGLLVATLADPFVVLDAPAVDGLGLTPILEHPAMLYHPPLLYLGLAGLLAPFALRVGSAVARSLGGQWLDDDWLERCRRWALACWVLLGVGMVAGAHWAYVEVGWGGVWAWDPVENTALLPWLALTAFLHAGVLRARVLAGWLAAAAFVVALLGTLLTRSGATQSVHAFAEDAAIGWALLVLVTLVAGGGSAAMIAVRPVQTAPRQPAARDRALQVQVGTTVLVLSVVLVGTVYPLARTLTGADDVAAVDAGFFSLFVGPLALVLLVLAGIGPRLGGGLALGPPIAGGLAGLVLAWVAGGGAPSGSRWSPWAASPWPLRPSTWLATGAAATSPTSGWPSCSSGCRVEHRSQHQRHRRRRWTGGGRRLRDRQRRGQGGHRSRRRRPAGGSPGDGLTGRPNPGPAHTRDPRVPQPR